MDKRLNYLKKLLTCLTYLFIGFRSYPILSFQKIFLPNRSTIIRSLAKISLGKTIWHFQVQKKIFKNLIILFFHLFSENENINIHKLLSCFRNIPFFSVSLIQENILIIRYCIFTMVKMFRYYEHFCHLYT